VPSIAIRELDELPAGLLEEIIEARHYARAKYAFDAADTPDAVKRLPASPLMDLAKVITVELVQEHMRRGRQ
jgi:hypothetical protein